MNATEHRAAILRNACLCPSDCACHFPRLRHNVCGCRAQEHKDD